MITCPNCSHLNPEGATQCEACYTELPQTENCPNCGAQVQIDATFCGQCGYSLNPAIHTSEPLEATVINSPGETNSAHDLESTVITNTGGASSESEEGSTIITSPVAAAESEETSTTVAEPVASTYTPSMSTTPPMSQGAAEPTTSVSQGIPLEKQSVSTPSPQTPPSRVSSTTQLQIQKAKLQHLQTDTTLELPQGLSVIHIGKPNEQIPPDLDVSGFPDSDIVSRVHADIRVEGDNYYLEDVGSSNGTYVNHTHLPPGNRHRLRSGDRVSLGKGDKVTFIFQLS